MTIMVHRVDNFSILSLCSMNEIHQLSVGKEKIKFHANFYGQRRQETHLLVFVICILPNSDKNGIYH